METLEQTYQKNIRKKIYKEQLLETGFEEIFRDRLRLNISEYDLQVFVDFEKEEILFNKVLDYASLQGKNSFTIEIPQKYFFYEDLSLLDFIQTNIDNIRINLNFNWIYTIL